MEGRSHSASPCGFWSNQKAFPNYPYPNLIGSIEVSIEALREPDRERYLDLAVFPQDQPIPEEALRVLWNLDELDTRDCMVCLAARSLATWVTEGTSLNLHDLQRDLIHNRREKDLPGLHSRLVKAWDALPKLDSYAWRWVPYHLVQAGRKDDLRRLLLDFDYLQAKLSSTDPNALIADYDYLPEDKDLRTVQAVLRQSAHILTGSPRELSGQLIGRLPEKLTPDIDALRSQASDTRGVRDRFHDFEHAAFLQKNFVRDFWLPWFRNGTFVNSRAKTAPSGARRHLLAVFPIKWLVILCCFGIFFHYFWRSGAWPRHAAAHQESASATPASSPAKEDSFVTSLNLKASSYLSDLDSVIEQIKKSNGKDSEANRGIQQLEDLKKRFEQLQPKYVEAVRSEDTQVTHELLGEIHVLQ